MMHLKKCPDCGAKNFLVNEERGEVLCKSCNFVLEDSLFDFGKDRAIGMEEAEKKSRSGAPFDPRIANNLITKVGNSSDLANLPKSTRNMIRRISKKNSWTSSGLENNLTNALSNMKLIASYLKLPEQVEKEAAIIYRRAAERGFTKARSCETTMVASIYAACRIYGIPKTLKEFTNASKIDKKTIGKTYRLLVRALNLKIVPTSPVDYLSRFASNLNLSAKVQSKAVELIEEAQKKKLTSGRSPMSLAASTLYLASILLKEQRTQKEITDITGITEVTLRNRCKELIKELKLGRHFKGKIAF